VFCQNDRPNLAKERQVLISPDALGVLCGSSYLNEGFEQLLRERLEGETYLNIYMGDAQQAITIDGIIESQVFEFENQVKRNVDITNGHFPGHEFYIQGLQPNKDKKFAFNRMRLDR
jgi:hypothetical protein